MDTVTYVDAIEFDRQVSWARAEVYIGRIRNPRKKAYARLYWKFLRGFAAEPERGELSYMAAQAVRLNLQDYFNGKAA